MHLAWCCKLYARQIERGAYLLHEHPANATSWQQDCVVEVLRRPGVKRIVSDQCQLAQETEAGDPIKKPTGFLSNAEKFLDVLERRCFGRDGMCSRRRGGRHALCHGKVARRAAIFQAEFCEAIVRGVQRQMVLDGMVKPGEHGPSICMMDGDDYVGLCGDDYLSYCATHVGCEHEASHHVGGANHVKHPLRTGHPYSRRPEPEPWRTPSKTNTPHDGLLAVHGRSDRSIDDLTGQPLPPELCREARRVEI